MAEDFDAYNPPVAEVEAGQIKGFMDDDTYTFLGVPYAASERFQMPQKVEAWMAFIMHRHMEKHVRFRNRLL